MEKPAKYSLRYKEEFEFLDELRNDVERRRVTLNEELRMNFPTLSETHAAFIEGLWQARREIVDAIVLTPCHVSGDHNMNHTPRAVCSYQLSDAFDRLLVFLEMGEKDLPRKLHDSSCHLCHKGPQQEALKKWARKEMVKDTPISLPTIIRIDKEEVGE